MGENERISKNINFLVADDSDVALEKTIGNLQEIGYNGKIFKAYDGKQAYFVAKTNIASGIPIDYIICDLHMPNENGVSMLKLINSDPEFPKVPILMLTYEEDIDTVFECLELGATGYALKKLDKDQFALKIEECWIKVKGR